MPDDNQTPPSNGATPQSERSLRDIAEDAYDSALDAQEAADQDGEAGQSSRARDSLGRFVAREGDEPGEAAAETPPSPESPKAQPPEVHPAPEGSSSEPPANWSAEDRQNFSRLKEGSWEREFLLRRHSEMEGEFQRRVQATAQADNFARSIAPIFNDPVIAGSLRQAGMIPSQAIEQWGTFHRWFMTDPQGLIGELQRRAGIDPAAMAPSRSGQTGGLSEADLKDPAIKFFADHVGQTSSRVQALEGLIQSMQQQDAERQNAEAMRVTRWSIDSFAEEKGADGKPLRPDFDLVLPQIIEKFQVNPGRDLKEAYEASLWENPTTRQKMLQAQRQGVEQQASNQRARAAVRGNARGLTSPVSSPSASPGQGSLRDVIESVADEVGF